MSFDEEWAELKAGAGGGREVHTRLNGPLPPDGAGPGKPPLKVTASVLRSKAGRAEEVAARFMRADNKAMTETGQVKASLQGFACASAFDTFERRWTSQTNYVRTVLVKRTAKSLRQAAKLFKGDDLLVGDSLGRRPGPWKEGLWK